MSRTSAATGPPATSAPTRRCAPWPRRSTSRPSGPHGLRDVAARRRGGGPAAGARAGRGRRPAAPRRAPTSTSSRCACPMRRAVHAALLDEGVLAGLPLARWYPDDPDLADALLVCATEVTTDADIERFASALAARVRRWPHERRRGAAGRRRAAGPGRRGWGTLGPAPRGGRRRSSRRWRSCRCPDATPTRCRTRPPTRSRASRPSTCAATPLGPAGAVRAPGHPPLHQPVAPQLLGGRWLLPARLVHHEAQPAGQRVGGPTARLRAGSIRSRPTRWPRARCSCCGSSRGCSPRSAACTRRRSSRPPARTAS